MDTKERNSLIEWLIKLFKNSGLDELELKEGNLEIKLKKSNKVINIPMQAPAEMPATHIAPLVAPVVETSSGSNDYSIHAGAVKAPTVGVVYFKPAPGKPDFVSEGSQVKSGDTLFLLEVMKVFTPIKAHTDGIVKKILIKSGDVVEYNEVLAVIE